LRKCGFILSGKSYSLFHSAKNPATLVVSLFLRTNFAVKLWSRPNIIPMPKTKVSVTLDSELAKEIDNYLRELVKKATD